MYEELIKRLRAVVDGGREEKCDGCPYEEDYPCCVDCLDTLHKQAADAIEVLEEKAMALAETLYAYEQEAIETIPAADVAPVVRGKWHSRMYYRKATESYDLEMHVCSECGSEWSYDAETGSSDFNYCPNCGAKMDESEDEE